MTRICGEAEQIPDVPPLISTRLREALGGEGCALCRVAADDLARCFSFLVEEG